MKQVLWKSKHKQQKRFPRHPSRIASPELNSEGRERHHRNSRSLDLLPYFITNNIKMEIATKVQIETMVDPTSLATVDKFIRCNDSSVNVLLLGASSSGKSTLLEVIKLCCGYKYTADELKFFKEAVFRKLVGSMQGILHLFRILELPIDDSLESHARTILMQPAFMEVDFLQPELTDAIEILWRHLEVSALYSQYIKKFQDFSTAE